jgi:hypothetical protein
MCACSHQTACSYQSDISSTVTNQLPSRAGFRPGLQLFWCPLNFHLFLWWSRSGTEMALFLYVVWGVFFHCLCILFFFSLVHDKFVSRVLSFSTSITPCHL